MLAMTAHVYLATMINVTKSNVSDASSLTASTICATFKRARTDAKKRSHAVCFCDKIHLKENCVHSIQLIDKSQNENLLFAQIVLIVFGFICWRTIVHCTRNCRHTRSLALTDSPFVQCGQHQFVSMIGFDGECNVMRQSVTRCLPHRINDIQFAEQFVQYRLHRRIAGDIE